MWRKPRIHDLEVPKDIRKQIEKSIYWNSIGALAGSSLLTTIQYILTLSFLWIFLFSILIFTRDLISIPNSLFSFSLTLFGILTIISYIKLYQWGWHDYHEAWYYFDEEDEIFIVTQFNATGWETIEIPYEEVDWIQFVQGNKGKAIIKSGKFKFETNRSSSKRSSSVTEIWQYLARIDTHMIDWPIELQCQICNRRFGHHIGTARCPFDDILLIEPGVKGRIDPTEQHHDDLDRI